MVIGAVALAGLGVGVALGGGDDGPAPAVAANSQLADITQDVHDVDECRRPCGPELSGLVPGHDRLDE